MSAFPLTKTHTCALVHTPPTHISLGFFRKEMRDVISGERLSLHVELWLCGVGVCVCVYGDRGGSH